MPTAHSVLREVFHARLGYAGYGYLRFFAKELGTRSEDLGLADVARIAEIADSRLTNILDERDRRQLVEEIRSTIEILANPRQTHGS